VRIIARSTLAAFWKSHAGAEGPLQAWFAEAKNASWGNPADIKARFRSADFLAGNRVVFNIGGNKYRLVVKIAYRPKIVYIRFVGTHADYDRIDAENV